MRQPPGECEMALSGTLLPSIATFAAGAAGREKAPRPAGPGNVSIGVVAGPGSEPGGRRRRRSGAAGAGATCAGPGSEPCPCPCRGGGRSCRS